LTSFVAAAVVVAAAADPVQAQIVYEFFDNTIANGGTKQAAFSMPSNSAVKQNPSICSGEGGIRTPANSPHDIRNSDSGGADSGAPTPADAEFTALLAAWARLPEISRKLLRQTAEMLTALPQWTGKTAAGR
jgi:hypothetical protein